MIFPEETSNLVVIAEIIKTLITSWPLAIALIFLMYKKNLNLLLWNYATYIGTKR